VLGAGLDTRAVRKAAPDLKYFEVDDGETLAMKQARMKGHGIEANVTFIAGNYVTDGLMPLLMQNGLDPMMATYIIWEGNTMYLPGKDGMAVMGHLKDSLRTFCLSFDYFARSIITHTTGELGLTRMSENFSSMGAPWVTGFDDIYQLARDAKLRVVEGFTTGELYRLYRPATPTQPAFGPYYSVCTLASL
jgi:O-methyltransferase involved in polyketide biosynthesis